MKKIPLTQGKFAIVDDDDYEFLIQWKWHVRKGATTYYAATNITGYPCRPKTYFMHRIILRAPKGVFVDHKNQNGLDNRKSNIRLCTRGQNQQNQRKPSSGKTSKYKGVRRLRAKGKTTSAKIWVANITYDGIRVYLGRHKTEEAAAMAYNKAAKKYHKQFARLNKIVLLFI